MNRMTGQCAVHYTEFIKTAGRREGSFEFAGRKHQQQITTAADQKQSNVFKIYLEKWGEI